jgi:hypothetical protein
MSRRSMDIRIERPAGVAPPSAAVSSVPVPRSQDGTQAARGLQRTCSPARLLSLCWGLSVLVWSAHPVVAQEPPPDTFQDAATRGLVERAIRARERSAAGLQSYEATLREHMYVGFTARGFRRERGLFEHERVARIRWSADDTRAIQWIAARTAVPIVGIDSRDPERGGRARVQGGDVEVAVDAGGDGDFPDEAADFLDETEFPGFDFDPAADRLTFGDDWAYHPLSDGSLVHYRYSLGDTLRVELPSNERSVVLYEVRVEPRRADFELVAGSLWIDSASAALVRATYRPARPWSLRVDDPRGARDVPGFVGPVEAEIRYITIESSLQELQYWLPRRFAFEGEGRTGGLFGLRVPVTMEWSVGGYVVNEPPFDIPVDGDLPEGWQREVTVETGDDGNETSYTIIVPTSAELLRSPELSEDFGRRSPGTFTADELDDLAGKLDGLIPTYQRFRPRLAWGLEDGQLRYNRVEGLSVGTSAAIPLAPELFLDLSARIGSGDREPNLAGGLRWGPDWSQWSMEGYYGLESMNDADDPFDLTSSFMNVALGTDRGEYYRVTGVSLGRSARGTNVTTDVSGFIERHGAVERTTDFSIRRMFAEEDTAILALPADALNVQGGRLRLDWFAGTDPGGFVFTGGAGAEIGVGGAEYRRAQARLSVSRPLFLGLATALEAAAGTSWGTLPLQRSYFLGGASTLRGFDANERFGPTFWRARGELATAFAGARVAAFSDLGWVGEREDFRLDHPLIGVGLGASLLDGIARIDVARGIRGSKRWKAYLYLDGLF